VQYSSLIVVSVVFLDPYIFFINAIYNKNTTQYYSIHYITLQQHGKTKQTEPRFITPVHDYSKRPLQLFWIDGLALKAIAESPNLEEETAIVTQVIDNDNKDNGNDDTTAAQQQQQQLLLPTYPLQPPVTSISAFKTTPSVHMGYAATWFGLSGAGLYMTRKLITKGRY